MLLCGSYSVLLVSNRWLVGYSVWLPGCYYAAARVFYVVAMVFWLVARVLHFYADARDALCDCQGVSM